MAKQYLVICGSKEPYVRERELPEMDRANTIRELAEGQFDVPAQVIEFDLEAGTARDVTREMATEVADLWACDGEELSDFRRDFIESHLGVIAANSFNRARAFNRARGF